MRGYMGCKYDRRGKTIEEMSVQALPENSVLVVVVQDNYGRCQLKRVKFATFVKNANS